jgi:hypothetical protein
VWRSTKTSLLSAKKALGKARAHDKEPDSDSAHLPPYGGDRSKIIMEGDQLIMHACVEEEAAVGV